MATFLFKVSFKKLFSFSVVRHIYNNILYVLE